VIRRLDARPRQCFFWATHAGAELDLLIVRGNRRFGFEFKRTAVPRLTRSMRIALADLKLERLDVIYAGHEIFPLSENIRALGLSRVLDDLEPLADA
jgi:predicted AAA+ superfamily ATPase